MRAPSRTATIVGRAGLLGPVGLVGLVTAATLTSAPAHAAAIGTNAHPSPTSKLFLTVSGSENTWIRGTPLDCDPASGPHPHSDAACTDITKAQGDLNALPGDPHACTKEYDPVTATAEGKWNGQTIHWSKTFPNTCTLDAETGPVFRF